MNLETQIIPKLEFDTPLETALAQGDKFRSELLPLQDRVRKLEITDAATYAEVGAILTQERGVRKQIQATWSPFDALVGRVKDFLKTSRQRDENLCEEIDGVCLAKMKPWERKEREEAAKEEKQLNKKNGDALVEVKPNLPSIGGYRKTVNYGLKLADRSKFLNAFLKGDKATRIFLGQFIQIDAQALAKYARDNKLEPAEMEKRFPKGSVSASKD